MFDSSHLEYPHGSGSVQPAPAAHPTVLVVEDETNIRELVCLHLGLEELTYEQAADGTGRARTRASAESSISSSST